MTKIAEQLKPKLAELPVEDRAELAQFLIGSLDAEADTEVSTVWHEEVSRRVAEIKAGKAVGIPVEQVFESIRTKYA